MFLSFKKLLVTVFEWSNFNASYKIVSNYNESVDYDIGSSFENTPTDIRVETNSAKNT